MTFLCECCPGTASEYARYIIHLQLAHPLGDLARAVEPSLFGTHLINEAPSQHPRVWDRWDQGGRSGPARRHRPPDAPAPEPVWV